MPAAPGEPLSRNRRRPAPALPADPIEPVETAASTPPEPILRLRALLALGLLGGLGAVAYPRVRATWELHTAAAALADHARCMVGPTGPALARDNPEEFNRLLRRRLVAAAPTERPFEACARLAAAAAGRPELERPHAATAPSFVEWGAPSAAGVEPTQLDALRVGTRRLGELARAAWPFVRGGYVHLVKPSIGTREAVHPVELPAPGVGAGLPAWRAHYRATRPAPGGWELAMGSGANLATFRSVDGGVRWRPAPARSVPLEAFAERCAATGSTRSWVIAESDDGKRVVVTSMDPDGAPQTADLTAATRVIAATSCDETALAALVADEGSRSVTLHLCRHRGACVEAPLPDAYGPGLPPRLPLDVARVRGTTVLAATHRGIVRVTSARDGAPWTPWAVAYDAGEQPPARAGLPPPGRLLVLGSRILLHGAAREGAYPVLFSDDQGATFHGP
ncbi:MAG: hypothetical protein IT376_20220 [Polyangiaceae bacterium]|nr:hypothetical protein [Polyangiaceae bacterium]